MAYVHEQVHRIAEMYNSIFKFPPYRQILLSEESVDPLCHKCLPILLQVLRMEGGDVLIGIFLAEKVVFVFSELMKGKQLRSGQSHCLLRME